jgi:cation transport ATPase
MSDAKASSSPYSKTSQPSHFGNEGIRVLLGLLLAVPVILNSFVVPITMHGLGHAPIAGAHGPLSLATLVAWSCATLALLLGMPLYESAWHAYRHASRANVDTLVVVSATLSYAYSCAIATLDILGDFRARHDGDSYFETAAILIPLVLLGRFFESRTHQLSRAVVASTGGSFATCASTDVSLNSTDNGAELQQLPRESPSLQVVAPAQGIASPSITDRVSAVYVPCVLIGASLAFARRLALLVSNAVSLPEGEHSFILYSLRCAIMVLVSSCPCAICLGTPTAIMVCAYVCVGCTKRNSSNSRIFLLFFRYQVGVGVGARIGVLFRDRASIERLQCASDIVFDSHVLSFANQPSVAEAPRPEAAQARATNPCLHLYTESPPFASVYLFSVQTLDLECAGD